MGQAPEQAAETATMVLPVTDLDGRVLEYARLGLRIVRHDSGRALVELPCGIVLVLVESAARQRRGVRATRSASRPRPTSPAIRA
jgi:hypothetical protein